MLSRIASIILFLLTLFLSPIAAIPISDAVEATDATDATDASAKTPPNGSVQVNSVKVDNADASVGTEGSGCQDGSVAAVIAADNTFLTLILDDFMAETGPTATHGTRAFCRVNVTLTSPGWAFDIDSVDFRGYYQLDKGVNASIVSRWKYYDSKGNAQKGKGNIQKKLQGPTNSNFLLHKDGDLSDEDEHSCSQDRTTLQVSLSATVSTTDKKAVGFVEGDSVDGHFQQILNIGWKKCS